MTLATLALLLWTGCSGSDSGEEPHGPVAGTGNEMVIYEANPYVFAPTEALNAVSARLEEMQQLGVDVLWLMPPFEQGKKNAIGSPYCVKDYKALHPDYGTLADLKALITKAHDRGMRVILDWVANHTSWDHDWLEHPSWYTQDAGGNIVSPPGMGWPDVADLNYENPEMRAAMIDAMKYWVTEADVDGYRCDHAEGVPESFWKEAIDELRKLKGERLLMLAEGGAASLYAAGFDLVYGWSFAGKLQEVFAGKATLSALYDVHRKEYQEVPAGKQRLRYSTNHDLASEHSPLQAYGNERGAMAAFVMATMLGGTPLIYSSQEVGYATPLSFFGYRALDWSARPQYLAEYKRLMELYRASAPLRAGSPKTYETGQVASFYFTSGQGRGMLVMVNTSAQPQTVKTPIERAGDRMVDLLTGRETVLPLSLSLEPYQYCLWEKK